MLESECTICVFLPTSHQISGNKIHQKKKKNPDSVFLQYDLYIISKKIYV